MTTIMKRPAGWPIPDMLDLFDAAWPFGARHPVHVEDFVDEGSYVLRAELPGLDVDNDVEVSISDNRLTITAKREQETHERHRTEFRYGSFSRTVTLPRGADAEKISASYRRGILEVRVPLAEPAGERKVQVESRPE